MGEVHQLSKWKAVPPPGHKQFKTPWADVLPKHDADSAEQLRVSLRDEGQKCPIDVDEDFNVLDGHTRLRLLNELGVEPSYQIVRGLNSDAEKKLYVLRTAGQCRRLSPQALKCWRLEQKKIVLELRGQDPKRWTQEALATLSQVGQQTISRWLREDPPITHASNSSSQPAESKTDARVSYSDKQVRDGLQRIANGESIKKAADAVGMNPKALEARKRRATVAGTMPKAKPVVPDSEKRRPGPPSSITEELEESVCRIYATHTWPEIREITGATHGQISQIVKRNGLQKGRGSRKANPLEAVQSFLGSLIRGVDRHVGEEADESRRYGTGEQYAETMRLVEEARKAIGRLRKQLATEQEART